MELSKRFREADDSLRKQQAPYLAFDWVCQELVFETASQQVGLRDAFISVQGYNVHRAVHIMELAWPPGTHWPSGEAYLRTLGWRPPDEPESEAGDYEDSYEGPELLELLYARLSHVTYRIYRDEQVRRMLDPNSPSKIKAYTHACINPHGDLHEDFCKQGVDKIVSIQEGLELMTQPSHTHPCCYCTVAPFPVTSRDKARLTGNP